MNRVNPSRPSRIATVATVAALVGGVAGSPAAADEIGLTDGRVYEGRVVHVDVDGVRIEIMAANIRVTLGFELDEVEYLVRRPLPAGFFSPKPAEPTPRLVAAGGTRYLDVPVAGRIGEKVVAEGVRRALSYAAARGIGHVVFYVDSEGGSREEAAEIAGLLQRNRGRLTYHTIVREADGVAGVFPAFSSHVFLKSGATLGDLRDVAAQLDVTFDDRDRQIHRDFTGGPREIGETLDIDDWEPEGETGSMLMSVAARQVARRRTEADELLTLRSERNIARRAKVKRLIESNLTAARRWHPERGFYHANWHENPRRLTDDSRRRWRNRTSASILFYNRAYEAIREMRDLESEAVRLNLERTYQPGTLGQMQKEVEIELGALRSRRRRRTL